MMRLNLLVKRKRRVGTVNSQNMKMRMMVRDLLRKETMETSMEARAETS
jgi:hypothetical protein